METSSSNKRVAKNTLFLYGRMAVKMFLGLWTSRLVINALGFTDQGLYNAVGGFITIFGLVTASISVSISRFINIGIGEGDNEKVNRVVRNSNTVQWVLALIVLLLSETVGLWFVNYKLVIPPDRLFAVNVVYQFAIGNMVTGLLSSMPNAVIMAYERMDVLAIVAIANSFLALGVALALTYYSGDRLIFYAFLNFIFGLGTRIFYTYYVRWNFKNIKLGFSYHKDIFYSIFAFAGWNSIGTSAAVLRTSGTSILLNIFGGPIANTINGIATSVNNLATMFVSDFTTAYNPQIIKKYAAQEYQNLIKFISQCAKFTYGLLLIIAVPVYVYVEPLLILWLKKIPEGTVVFARLIIIFSLIESICRPLITAKNATGEIRNYQIIVGGILLMTLPIAYLFLKLGFPIYYAYVAFIITSTGAFIARMVMLRGALPYWSTRKFLYYTVSRCVLATVASFALPAAVNAYVDNDGFLAVFFGCAVGFAWTCGCFFLIACDKAEKIALKRLCMGFMEKILNRKS